MKDEDVALFVQQADNFLCLQLSGHVLIGTHEGDPFRKGFFVGRAVDEDQRNARVCGEPRHLRRRQAVDRI